jgi:hypothetical protein
MSLDGIGGTVTGRADTAAPSSVDGSRPEAHRSCVDLRHSVSGILVVITDMGRYWCNRTGATTCRMTSRRSVECWHDKIDDHTLGDTVFHGWLPTPTGSPSTRGGHIAGGSPHRQPTTPRRARSCTGNRHERKGLTAKYPFGSHLRRPIMGCLATA